MTDIPKILTYGRATVSRNRLPSKDQKCRLYRVHGGEMRLSAGDRHFSMHAGCLYLLPSGFAEAAEEPFYPGQFFDITYISFVPSLPILFDLPLAFPLDEYPVLSAYADAFERFIAEYRYPAALETVRAHLSLILSYMNMLRPFPAIPDARLVSALSRIHREYAQDLTVETLAKDLYMHPNSLIRLFRSDLHTTPHRYLQQYRLMMAEQLLLSGCSVTETAEQCGYASVSIFSRAFRARYGYPPSSCDASARKPTVL